MQTSDENPADTSEKKAWDFALKRISRKERTSSEIQELMSREGFPPDVITHTVARLLELRFLDDDRYAAAFTRLQSIRGKGPSVIQLKLRHKGISVSKEWIQSITQEADGKSDLERAMEIIARRYPEACSDRKVWKKAYDALIRRGFSFEIAKQALDQNSKRPRSEES